MPILVNVTSVDPEISYDKSCSISAGEHEFITHDSCTAYEFAMQRKGVFVDHRVEIGNYIQKGDATNELVEKLRTELKKSTFAKRGIKDDYDAALRAEERRRKTSK